MVTNYLNHTGVNLNAGFLSRIPGDHWGGWRILWSGSIQNFAFFQLLQYTLLGHGSNFVPIAQKILLTLGNYLSSADCCGLCGPLHFLRQLQRSTSDVNPSSFRTCGNNNSPIWNPIVVSRGPKSIRSNNPFICANFGSELQHPLRNEFHCQWL